MEQELLDTKQILKQSTRELVYNNDPVLRNNLRKGTEILHSTQYPTQVFELHDRKYVRINTKDIEAFGDDADELTTDLLKLMLSMDSYHTTEGTDEDEPDLATAVESAVDEYRDMTGDDLADSDLIELDEFRRFVPEASKLPIEPKVFRAVSGDTKSDDGMTDADDLDYELAEDTSMSDDASKLTEMMYGGEDGDGSDDVSSSTHEDAKQVPLAELEVEQSLDEVERFEGKSVFSSGSSILNKQEILNLQSLSKKLLRAFRGTNSKNKTYTPKKHLNSKNLSMDSDRIYITKQADKGKHIKFNLVIDMSGSMYGEPVKDAVSLIYIFNKLAHQGYLTGSVIYSTTNNHHKITLPVSDAEVLSLNNVCSSEGLAQTIEYHKDTLKNTNLICITDGDIVDEPIDKLFWLKHKIVSTGVYVNPHLENVLEYTGKLDKWFTHSLVRQNLNDLVELLVRVGIRG